MAIQSLTDLKALINSTIQDNTTNDISGSDVQTALINAIDTLDSLEGFINVHKANGQTTITAYGSKALARAAVPDDCKKEGVVIAYKISTGWLIEQNLDATAGTWGDDASWQTIGPVSVSQNTSTGHTDITIGSQTTPMPSVEEVFNLDRDINGLDLTFTDEVTSASGQFLWEIPLYFKQGVAYKISINGLDSIVDSGLVNVFISDGNGNHIYTSTYQSGTKTITPNADGVKIVFQRDAKIGTGTATLILTSQSVIDERLKQSIGTSTTDMMSQKAITDAIKGVKKVVYVATTGSDTNDGSIEHPFATLDMALSAADNIIIRGGWYNNVSIDLSTYKEKDIRISAMVGEKVILSNYTNIFNSGAESEYDNGLWTFVKSWFTLNDKTHSANSIYMHNVNDGHTLISDGEIHPLQKGRRYRCDSTKLRYLGLVSNLSDTYAEMRTLLAEGIYSWAYREIDSRVFFTKPQATSSTNPLICSKGPIIYGTNNGNRLHISGIDFYYGMVSLVNVNDSEFVDCSSKYSYGLGGFHWTDCRNLVFKNCEVAMNEDDAPVNELRGDGFNGDSNITPYNPNIIANDVQLIDCWAHDNSDDGYSDHANCNSIVRGGLYEYNGKGGVTPSYGSHSMVYNVLSRNNRYGFYYCGTHGDNGINGNVMLYNCIADSNQHGFIGTTTIPSDGYKYNKMICVQCISNNNSASGYNGYHGNVILRNCFAKGNQDAKDTVTVDNSTLVE